MAESANKRTRASGEVLELLVLEFSKNQNPLPDQRKDISERTNMSEKAVRIWFQNRRAKLRKAERMGLPANPAPNGKSGAPSTFSNLGSSIHSSRSNSNTSVLALKTQAVQIPVEVNKKYCFVDCTSLSVGSWQRIKSGSHDTSLPQTLVNLAPFTLNAAMAHVDLMVILSRRNQEINYFFLAVSNNTRILFRIFYPLSSIIQCLLLDNNINKESNELRLSLSRKPRFSVFFFDSANSNLNQWSICDDFSEAQQVSNAVYAAGGNSTPHVLVGPKHALLYLKSLITEHNLGHSQQSAFDRAQAPDHGLLHNGTPDFNHAAMANQLFDESKEHGDLQLNHDSWDQLSDKALVTALVSARPPFEAYPLFQHLAHQSHDESILTTTPDFFSAVQTPGSRMASTNTNTDEDGVIPSPSYKKAAGSPYAEYNKLLNEYESQQAFNGDHNHGDVYDFNLHEGHNDDFQASDLLVHSPEAATHETPGASNNQVDIFIDFNSH